MTNPLAEIPPMTFVPSSAPQDRGSRNNNNNRPSRPELPPGVQNKGPKPQPPLGAVEVAKVAVPPDADDVDEEHAVLEGHDLEVDGLGEGPEHVV